MLTLFAYIYGLVAFKTLSDIKEVMLLGFDVGIMKLHLHLLSALDVVGITQRRPFALCGSISCELI